MATKTRAAGLERWRLPSEQRTFSLGPGAAQRTLLAHLRTAFRLRAQPRFSTRLTHYDTFDWRIHTAGMRLSIHENDGSGVLMLHPIRGGRGEVLAVDKVPAFASELPDGPVRRKLEPLTEVRRLLPLAWIELSSRCHAVLDEQEKTVVRIFFDACRVGDPQELRPSIDLPLTVRVERVEGYAEAYAQVLACMAERRGLSPIHEDLLERALRALGQEPGKRHAGLEGALDPGAPRGTAFLSLQRGLFAAVLSNEPGIRADLDSECLHDLRVAVRRSRVLHRIFRVEITGGEFEALRPGFKWLGKISGPTRDLDVHLIALLEQQQAMPEDAEGLRPLIALLRERRQEEWARLVADLDSPRYAEFVALAGKLLGRPDGEAALRIAAAGPPLGPWASRRIARAHRRLLKHGRSIDRSSPDAKLHELRIDGKRLRYLLEFFHSLYAEDEIGAIVKELKRLQNNLGDFNDACVQARVLRGLVQDLDRLSGSYAETLLSLGRLVEREEARKAAQRAAFEKRFARFAARKTCERFRRLFGNGKNPGQPALARQMPGDGQDSGRVDEADASRIQTRE